MKLWMVLCAFVLLVGYVFHCAFQADSRAAAKEPLAMRQLLGLPLTTCRSRSVGGEKEVR